VDKEGVWLDPRCQAAIVASQCGNDCRTGPPLQSVGSVAVPERWDRGRTDPSVVFPVPWHSGLYVVQRALGHRHITTTEIYARVGEEQLRRAVGAVS